ncbi:MAG: hypothetical protein ACKOCO_17760 [Bacteroidota bacterium]|jgi:uncharacterized membrane protein
MSDDKSARLIILFVVAVMLLNYPLIGIFDRRQLQHGIPVMYGYLFVVWALIVLLVGLAVQNRNRRKIG